MTASGNETATLESPETDDFFIETTLGEVPEAELRRYEKLLDLKNTRIKFAEEYHVNSRGEPMSWGFPHILDLYEEVSPIVTVQGSTQCMKTEWVVCSNLAAMYCGINTFFVLPKHNMRATYVRNHIDRVIELSKGYQNIAGGRAVGSHLKQFGRGFTRYVSSNKREDFTEYPADCSHRNSSIKLVNSVEKRICDVCIGDTITAYDGRNQVPDKVVDVRCKGVKDMLSVKTSDGRELRCTLGERFYTDSGWKYLYELVRNDCYEFNDAGAVRYIGEKSGRDDLRVTNGRHKSADILQIGSDRTYNQSKRGPQHSDSMCSRAASVGLLSAKTQDDESLLRKAHSSSTGDKLRGLRSGVVYYNSDSRTEAVRGNRVRADGGATQSGTSTSENYYSGLFRHAYKAVFGLLVHGRRLPIRSLHNDVYGLLQKTRSGSFGGVSFRVRGRAEKKQGQIRRRARLERLYRTRRHSSLLRAYKKISASRSSLQMGQLSEAASLVLQMCVGETIQGSGAHVPTLRETYDHVYGAGTGELQTTCSIIRCREVSEEDGKSASSTSLFRSSEEYARTTGVFSKSLHSEKSGCFGDHIPTSGSCCEGEERKGREGLEGGREASGNYHRGGGSTKERSESKGSRKTPEETKLLNDKGEWVSITSITYDSYDEVWDIQTEKHHNFYAEGLLVHNCVIVEELDHCDQTNLIFAKDRLEGSPHKFYYRIGNPTIEGFGINEHYLAGDRKRWFVKCCACGKYRAIDWFKHVVKAIVGSKRAIKGYSLRDTEWTPGCARDIRAVCPCGGAFIRMDGLWRATKPENYYLGGSSYHISSLMNVQKNIEELYSDFLPAISDFSKMEHFYRSVLGLPYSPGDSKVSSSVISDSSIPGFQLVEDKERDQAYLEADAHEGPCFLGMDVGNSLDVSIIYRNPRGTKILVFCGKLNTVEEVRELIARYNVHIAVVDIGPERALVRDFQNVADIPVWLCQYSESASGVSGGLRVNNVQREVLVDRTEHLDGVFKGIHSKHIRFPENYLKLLRGAWYSEMTASTRTLEIAARGKAVYRWSDTKADHQFHALAYANLAAKMGGDSISVYVG